MIDLLLVLAIPFWPVLFAVPEFCGALLAAVLGAVWS